MAAARFTAMLLEGHKGAAVEVPFDPAERWSVPARAIRAGRRGHLVQGTVNGIAFDSAIVPRSKRFWLLVDAAVMKAAKVTVGDRVKIAVELGSGHGTLR